MDWQRARCTASSWRRPYTSVQRAWVDALGVTPTPYRPTPTFRDRTDRYAGIERLMRQRHGVEGL